MSAFTKIAVTVPTSTFAALERVRRRLGTSRSATVSLAIEEWLRMADISDADRRYVEGYRKQPEQASAWGDTAHASWGTWEPGKPSRAAEPAARKPPRKRPAR